jgi:glycosyltransferase involved in cell wall biosynthesis
LNDERGRWFPRVVGDTIRDHGSADQLLLMNEQVTVCITTAGRPHFLRSALQSVQNQINRDVIGEIVVSENNGDRGSEALAREFPELPIRYIFREPTLPMLAHLFSTFRLAQTPYVAILNDDDWWSANHLAEAVAALRTNPSASAYVSASLFVQNEAHDHPFWIDRSAAVWLLAGKPSWLKLWMLDAKRILALGWLYTPFHWSTLVARTTSLNEVLDLLENDTRHTHTIDRLVFNHLALRGPLCYNPVADTFVRWHAQNWVKSQDPGNVSAVIRSTIEVTERLAAEQGWNLQEVWAEALARMPREVENELLYRFLLAHTREELRKYGLEQFFHVRPPRPRLRALRNLLANAKHFVFGD